MTFEEAYFGPRPRGPDVIPRLIAELRSSSDGYTRGKFCELLGEMGDESVIPVLTEELTHADQNVREWAKTAIAELRSPEAKAEKRNHLENFKTQGARK